MKRLTAIALVLLLAPALGLAKKNRASKDDGGAFGGFGPQVAFTDFNAINLVLTDLDIEELDAVNWMFGGGGWAHVGRVVLGGSGWGGSQVVSGESVQVRVDIGGGQFEAGYDVLQLKHCIITPMLGIGGSGYEITVENRKNLPGNLEQLIRNPGPSSTIGFTGFTLTPEVVFTFPISFFGLQLKTGYGFTPGNPEWKFENGASMINGPDVARGMPFVALNLVFGGMDGKKFKR